ncbi:putative glucuronoxylan glucuronosyltransferase F8H [Abeliophyllum distichum]|uniref:Glucuronoxylan glucuronosyltransferase F8H n=1 Tax=Abeliophyllum distichum TaxID=126358 RepID=A0ABD1VWM5_9LAMI
MLDCKRPMSSKGFYVKMRLLHNTRHDINLFSRYFKWMLWFSLSFCFFASFIVYHKKPTTATSFTRTTVPHSKASRALIEESALHHNQNTQDFFKGMKIFIYDLPSKYNSDWLSNERCSSHLFAAEVAIHRALMHSHARTIDPLEADFFFVPVYVSCNFSTINGFPAIGHARSLIASAVQHISSQFPFWNRSLGSDHIFVASHDFGSCFHTMENMAKADGIPEFLRNSIILQTFGVHYRHPCNDAEHVVIPPYVSPESVRTTLEMSPLNGRRDIFAFFRGKMEVHPKNISGRFYSNRVRTMMWQKFGNDRRFYLKRHRFSGYQSEVVRSKFCLCPLGWAPWSPRIVESVVLGCVPVIIADGSQLPFPSAVPWAEISITVAEKNVSNLGKILENVAATNLSSMQRRLWDPEIRKSLLFNVPMMNGDATWQVLESLSTKLYRSHNKTRVSSQ